MPWPLRGLDGRFSPKNQAVLNLGKAKSRRSTKMEIIKKHKVSLVVAIALPAAVLFLFFRMYQKDVREIADFSASYEKFEKALSDFSRPYFASNNEGKPATDDFERKADEALSELYAKAAARLSSLIKNDAELMDTTLEIAELCRKELAALKATKRTVPGKDVKLDKLAEERVDWRNKRQTAYARFKELAGVKD